MLGGRGGAKKESVALEWKGYFWQAHRIELSK
jgi:hypothetical protein